MTSESKHPCFDLALVVDAHYVPDELVKHHLQSPLSSFPASARSSISEPPTSVTTVFNYNDTQATATPAMSTTSLAASLSPCPIGAVSVDTHTRKLYQHRHSATGPFQSNAATATPGRSVVSNSGFAPRNVLMGTAAECLSPMTSLDPELQLPLLNADSLEDACM